MERPRDQTTSLHSFLSTVAKDVWNGSGPQGILLQLFLKSDQHPTFGVMQQSSPYLNSTSQTTTRRTIVQISLLCVPFKLLERLLLAQLEPIIDPHSPDMPEEQAGFRRGRSTVYQIVNLILMTMGKPSKTGHKAGEILVDLTAEYDTVWHQGLTLKLSLTVTLCGSSLLSSPTAALHSRQATDRSADCVD